MSINNNNDNNINNKYGVTETKNEDGTTMIDVTFTDELLQNALRQAGVNVNLGEEKLLENEEKRQDLIKESNSKDGINFFQKFDYIPLKDLHELPAIINFFPPPTNEQLLQLVNSIESAGVITPLLIMDNDDGDGYMVICGRSRLMALNRLYEISNLDKYAKAPCMILDRTKVDPIMIQNLVIATNMQYRTIDRTTLIKAVILQQKILKTLKKSRGDFNITRSLAGIFHISKTSVEDYLCIDRLHPEIKKRVYAKIITLQAGKNLSKLDHEKQLAALALLGEAKINDMERIKILTNPKYGRILDPVAQTMVNDTWDLRLDRVSKMTPSRTRVKLDIERSAIDITFKALISAKRTHAIEEQRVDSSNNYFKISVNKKQIKEYTDAGLIDKDLVDKLRETKFDKILNHKF